MVKRGNPDASKSDISCPTPASEYNRHMGGVDLLDHHKCYCSYNGKSKRWWLHLFFHMFDLCIVNVSIPYKYAYRIFFHTNEIQAEGSSEVPTGDDRLVGKSLH